MNESTDIRISACQAYRYELPVHQPLPGKAEVSTTRTGFLIKIVDQGGVTGWGDVAPLPGVSRERTEQAAQQCVNIAANSSQWERVATGRQFLHRLYPSVLFGVDCALSMIRAHRKGVSVACHLDPDAPAEIAVNALLSGADADILEHAAGLRGEGYRAAKLKIGRQAPEADADLVNAVRHALGEGIELRLDANRAWDLRAACDFAERVNAGSFSYIEEPLKRVAELEVLVERTGIPVALDESLSDSEMTAPLGTTDIVAFVIKPTLLGGLSQIEKWVQIGRQREVEIVFSSTFESGLGILHIANLAAALAPQQPAGLDTGSVFQRDIVSPRILATGGSLPTGGLFHDCFHVVSEELFELDATRQTDL